MTDTKNPLPVIIRGRRNNDDAPFIFFDKVTVVGAMTGSVIQIELGATALSGHADETTSAEVVTVARLRCSAEAATALRNATHHALKLLEEPHSQPSIPANKMN